MSFTNSFLDRFSTDRRFSIPYSFLWTVTINDNELPDRITSALSKINQSWKVSSSIDWTDTANDNILVAQEVTIPTESIEISSLGQENRGGFMPGYGVTQRTEFISRNVVINFLETESDIETELFRPWIIALGVDGLSQSSGLKCNIDVKQYTRDGIMRKHYMFEDAFPTNSEGYTLTYSGDEFLIKSVTFGYTNYIIK